MMLACWGPFALGIYKSDEIEGYSALYTPLMPLRQVLL